MSSSIALIMNAETFYHQISNQYYTMKKLGPIIDDVLREKNCNNYINNIKGNVMESISIFDNFNFMQKYEEKFNEYIETEFIQKVEALKSETPAEKTLTLSLELIYKYYVSQLEFFEQLCSLDTFFEKYKTKFKNVFFKSVKFVFIESFEYADLFSAYMNSIFEDWKRYVHKNFSNADMGITHNNQRYEFIKGLVEEEMEEEEGVAHFGNANKIFNVTELKQFITFHEIFGLTSSHMKPHFLNFMISKLSQLIDYLVAESFDGEDDFDDVVMPYVDVFSYCYVKTLGEKMDQLRSQVFQEKISHICEIQHFKDKFSLKFMEALRKDMNYIYIKKVGSKILDLVLDMPNTIEKVKEIAEYVKKVNMTQEVCQWLRGALVSRLLSPGVTTYNILISYFNIVATLKIIDSNMLNLSKVIAPVKKFLLKRCDLIRCIIAFWKEEREGSLARFDPLTKIPIQDEGYWSSSDDDVKAAEEWSVKRIEDSKRQERVKYKYSDQTKILVDLYGSEEGFLEEYENHLSETVLLDKKFNKTKELTDIELLKHRFGEYNLLRCNVLFKDIEKSDRYNKKYHKDVRATGKVLKNQLGLSNVNLKTLIVSTGYWPINYEENLFDYPKEYQKILDSFEEGYRKQNIIQKLNFHNNLGSVKLKLKFPSGESHFKCQPIQAVLIGFFDKKKMEGDSISLDYIAEKLNTEENRASGVSNKSYIRKKMFYWIHQGVIIEKKVSKAAHIEEIFDRKEQEEQEEQEEKPEIHYFLVKDLPPKEDEEDEEEINENYGDEEHESIAHEFLNFRGDPLDGIQAMEKEIMNILVNNGPKKIDKLFYLIDTLRGQSFCMPWGKNNIEELLESMVKRGKIRYENYVYYPINN